MPKERGGVLGQGLAHGSRAGSCQKGGTVLQSLKETKAFCLSLAVPTDHIKESEIKHIP